MKYKHFILKPGLGHIWTVDGSGFETELDARVNARKRTQADGYKRVVATAVVEFEPTQGVTTKEIQ